MQRQSVSFASGSSDSMMLFKSTENTTGGSVDMILPTANTNGSGLNLTEDNLVEISQNGSKESLDSYCNMSVLLDDDESVSDKTSNTTTFWLQLSQGQGEYYVCQGGMQITLC